MGIATRQAVIVAAGLGTRLQSLAPGGETIKPLTEIGGVPLLKRVLDQCGRAGIELVHIVVGHLADQLTPTILEWDVAPEVRLIFNPRYELSNGVSLYCGARECSGPFVLLMSDHIFQLRNLTGLLNHGLGDNSAVLAIDRKVDKVFDLDDATKIMADGPSITAIGKKLQQYNAIDTGMFLLSADVGFRLQYTIDAHGDASISDVMNAFIREGCMGAYDIGDGLWQDVDDPAMLVEAQRLVQQGVFDQ